MKTLFINTVKLSIITIIASLLISSFSVCNKTENIESTNIKGDDSIVLAPTNLSYLKTQISSTFGQAGSTETPSIKWNGKVGMFKIINGENQTFLINERTGQITWTANTAIATYNLKVQANNQAGESEIISLTIEITPQKTITEQPEKRPFQFLQWVRYNGLNPAYDLSAYGLTKINLKTEGELVFKKPDGSLSDIIDSVNIETIATADKNAPSTIPVSLDLEQWEFYPRGATLNKTIDSLKKAIRIYKNINPTANVGGYALPLWNRYSYDGINTTAKLTDWQTTNDLLKAVGKELTHIENYGYNTVLAKDSVKWKNFVKAQLDEVKRIPEYANKPIYLWICPQYYIGANKDFLEPTFWAYQLNTLYDLGYDGFIIWTSNKNTDGTYITFNANMPWLQITTEFIRTHK